MRRMWRTDRLQQPGCARPMRNTLRQTSGDDDSSQSARPYTIHSRPTPNASATDLGCIFRQLHHVVQHHPLLFCDRSSGVVPLQRLDQPFVQRHPTQKLCVRLNSINAAVSHRDHGRDHLVLAALEWQFRRHQHTEGGKGVIQSSRDQAVRGHNPRWPAIRRWVDRIGVLLGIQSTLVIQRLAQFFVSLRYSNGLNPGHKRACPFYGSVP